MNTVSRNRPTRPTKEALRNRAAGRAAAREARRAARQALVNPEAPTLIKENYFTEFEYAKAVTKDIRTVRRHRNLRLGPPWLKIGRSVFYPRDGVLAYLREQAVQPCRRRRAA